MRSFNESNEYTYSRYDRKIKLKNVAVMYKVPDSQT